MRQTLKWQNKILRIVGSSGKYLCTPLQSLQNFRFFGKLAACTVTASLIVYGTTLRGFVILPIFRIPTVHTVAYALAVYKYIYVLYIVFNQLRDISML